MRTLQLCFAVVLIAALVGAVNASVPLPAFRYDAKAGNTHVTLNVPPRFMWGWGDGLRGYCGSFSYQSFGLRFGNYISAEPMRYAADGRELLLAVNDDLAAKHFHFNYELWNYAKEEDPQSEGFLEWVRTNTLKGFGVVGGFFEQKEDGDPDYDHIMPIVGFVVEGNETEARAGKGQLLGIYYNDLFREHTLFGNLSAGFVEKRRHCVASDPESAAPYEFCLPHTTNYGIALQGMADAKGETYAAQLSTNSWTEPDYGMEDNLHQPVTTLTATLNIEGLQSGYHYAVLRFDHAALVPTENFLAGAYSRKWTFLAGGETHEMTKFDDFRSDATVFYRVVLLS